MDNTAQLNLSYIKPCLVDDDPPKSSGKPEMDEVDVPDLATSSWSEEEESKRQEHKENELIISIDDTASESTGDSDELMEGEASPRHQRCDFTGSFSGSVCDILSVALHEREEGKANGEEDPTNIRQSLSRIPSSIVLLDNKLLSDVSSSNSSAEQEENPSSMQERLECAETLIKSFRETIHSNEHLVDSLYLTLTETREQAQNLLADRNELLQAIDLLHAEQEDHAKEERITQPKYFMKLAMTISLLLYLSGMTSEYALVATVVVHLLEDVF
eukprot:scaffold918_cov126-Cylindrotheca_fusiformis.AAC.78